jgi:hypothetical protein
VLDDGAEGFELAGIKHGRHLVKLNLSNVSLIQLALMKRPV